MKLVIDIPQKEYERAKNGEWNCTIINKAVTDATPLEEVLEDIKAELKEDITGLDKDLEKDCTIRWACDVIDKHISGKGKE